MNHSFLIMWKPYFCWALLAKQGVCVCAVYRRASRTSDLSTRTTDIIVFMSPSTHLGAVNTEKYVCLMVVISHPKMSVNQPIILAIGKNQECSKPPTSLDFRKSLTSSVTVYRAEKIQTQRPNSTAATWLMAHHQLKGPTWSSLLQRGVTSVSSAVNSSTVGHWYRSNPYYKPMLSTIIDGFEVHDYQLLSIVHHDQPLWNH